MNRTCLMCGSSYAVPKCRQSSTYCSRNCAGKSRRGKPRGRSTLVNSSCSICGSSFVAAATKGQKTCGRAECVNGLRSRSAQIHGMCGTTENNIWNGMIQRCTNANKTCFDRYGGRGVTVCQRWLDSFESFYEDMGPRPTMSHTLDRINNELGYEPGNCRWATLSQQARNRRDSVLIPFGGMLMNAHDIAPLTGLTAQAIYKRQKRFGSLMLRKVFGCSGSNITADHERDTAGGSMAATARRFAR